MTDTIEIATIIIGAVGSSGLIILGLSGWLGKVWANRIMEIDRANHAQDLEKLRATLRAEQEEKVRQLECELNIFREKHLKVHQDKLTTYRLAVDIIATVLTDIERFGEGRMVPIEVGKAIDRFTTDRIRLYGYMGLLAPQSVMDAQDALMDYVLQIINGSAPYIWEKIRDLGLKFLNEVRNDVGPDSTPIEYRGKL
jgi:hypothetical protein